MNQPQQVTMLDDLPDLDEIAPNYDPHAQPGPDVTKFIKNQHIMPNEAGMRNNANYPPTNYHSRNMVKNPYPFAERQNYGEPIEEYFEPPTHNNSWGNCLDVNGHIEACPICQKLYKNDKTVMIIIIVILAILCLLLLKKVLNV